MLYLAPLVVVGLLSGDASAQDRSARVASSAEILCLDVLDVDNARNVANAILRGNATVEAEQQTNCLVVIGAADLSTVRQVLTTLDQRANTRRRGAAARREPR
jgi:hypothetical protein